MKNDTRLARMQGEWAGYFRAPASTPRPVGTVPRRINVYAELLRNNIGGFIHQCFPICRQSLEPEQWEALIDLFFSQGKWHHTPFFHEIPKGFVTFLQESTDLPALPPWFAEMAHYEWLELAVETGPDLPPQYGPQGLAVCPGAQLEGYEWPVHTIGPESGALEQAPTFIVVFRNRQHRVRFSVLTPPAAQLLASLQENGCDWQAACTELAGQWATTAEAVARDTQALQAQWLADGLLLQQKAEVPHSSPAA